MANSGNYVELYGIDEVLNQIALRNTPYFGVYIQKQIKFEHTDDDMQGGIDLLRECLEAAAANGTVVTYIIRFYKRVNANGDLDKNSEFGSCTFRLNKREQPAIIAGVSSSDTDSKLDAILAYINREIKQKEEDADDKETAGSKIGAAFAGILENEQFQIAMIERVMVLVDKLLPAPKAARATLGAVSDDQMVKINQAVSILLQCDPLLGDHLLKLAELAEKDRGQFNMIINAVEKM